MTRWCIFLSCFVFFLGLPSLFGADLIISEFMADNNNTIADEDGDNSDWIEIHNPQLDELSLEDWHLTDDATELDKWNFPDVSIAGGGYRTGQRRIRAIDPDHYDKASARRDVLSLNMDPQIF